MKNLNVGKYVFAGIAIGFVATLLIKIITKKTKEELLKEYNEMERIAAEKEKYEWAAYFRDKQLELRNQTTE